MASTDQPISDKKIKIHATDQRIIDTVEQLLRDEVVAVNARNWEDFEDRFFDPHFSARLPHPLPPANHGRQEWVEFLKMMCEENPQYKATALSFSTTVNDRRDKAESFVNWQVEGLHRLIPSMTLKVLGLWTFRKTDGKWRIYTYEGWDGGGGPDNLVSLDPQWTQDDSAPR